MSLIMNFKTCRLRISIHTNLTEKHTDFFTLDVFQKMKQRPCIINTSRGAAIVEQDLLTALDTELIKSAALDALRDERPEHLAKNPFLGRDNVIVTPLQFSFWNHGNRKGLHARIQQHV